MDTPRPSPRTNRTRRVPHPAAREQVALLGAGTLQAKGRAGDIIASLEELGAIGALRGKGSGGSDGSGSHDESPAPDAADAAEADEWGADGAGEDGRPWLGPLHPAPAAGDGRADYRGWEGALGAAPAALSGAATSPVILNVILKQ